MALVQLLYLRAAHHNVNTCVQYIPGQINKIANSFSCFWQVRFRELAPNANLSLDNIPVWPAHAFTATSCNPPSWHCQFNPLHLPIWINHICDQICQKGSYTRTASGLTFHYHSTDTTIDQQFMLVLLPNLQRSAFTEASFTGLSGVHGCSGGLLMASACPARQTDGRELPQDWLVRLGIYLATF